MTRLGIDISAQAEDGTGLEPSIASVLWRPNEAEPPSLSAFAFATANRFAKSRLPRICYAFVRGSSRIKLTQQNPSPSLPLAPVRALNTRRIEPVPFVNNQSPMKRSTSPSIIKAKQFYSPIPCSPSLPSSRMRARGPTPSAPPPPMMLPDTIWDCNQHREISETRRAIKLAPKEGRGDLVNSLEELCSVMNRS